MASYYSDTHPKMEALQIKLLRETPPWRKMEMMVALYNSSRAVALEGIRHRHPSAGENELYQHLAELLLGSDLAKKVLGKEEDRA